MTGDDGTRAVVLAALVVASMVVTPLGVGVGLTGVASAQTTNITATPGTSDTLAGAANQSIGNGDGRIGPLYVNETSSDALGASGTLRLVIPSGENVTFNTSTSTPGDVSVSSGSVADAQFLNDSALALNYSGLSTEATDSFAFGDLAVDVATTDDFRLVVRGTGGSDVSATEISLLVDQPRLSGGGAVANAADQNVGVSTLTVDLPVNNGSIAAGSEFVLRASASSNVTFDDSLTPGDVSVTYDQTGGGSLDVQNLAVDGNRLVFPVNETFGFNGQITGQLEINGVRVDLAPSAQSTQLSLRTVPREAISGVTVESTSSSEIIVERPSLFYDDDKISVGAEKQLVERTFTISPTNTSQIETGENVTLVLNNTNSVKFDTTSPVDLSSSEYSASDLGPPLVTENRISVNVTGPDVPPRDSVIFTFIRFNSTHSSGSATNSSIDIIGKTGPNNQVTSRDDDGSVVRVVTPTIGYAGDTIAVGGTRSAVPLSDVTVRANDDRNVGPDTTIDVLLPPSSQISFNQSALDSAPDLTYVSATRASYQVDTAPAAGDTVVVSDLAVDLTADSQDAVLDVITDTGNGTVTQQAPNELTVVAAVPDAITADLDDDGRFGTDTSNTSRDLRANETDVGAVRVTNQSSPLPNESVDLSVTSAPSGAGTVLNASSVETNADGVAQFEFSATETGTYVIDAVAGDASVELSYNVTAEAVDDVTVAGAKDAVIGGPTADTNLAAYEIRLVDDQGNVVTDTAADFRVSPAAGTVVDVVADYDPTTGVRNGSLTNDDGDTYPYDYDPATDPNEPGVLYALVDVNGTTPGAVSLTAEAQLFTAANGTGTAIAHDLTGTTLTVEKAVPAAGETVTVTARGTNASGEPVTVPRLQTTFGSSNTSVVTQPTPSPTPTAVNGTATATATAETAGTTTLNGRVNGATAASRSVRVESLAAASSTAAIQASPATAGSSATHTVTVSIGNESAGESLSSVTVDYDVGDPPADVSQVGAGDVVTASLNGTGLLGSVTGVTRTAQGTALRVAFDGSPALSRNDRLVVEYTDVTNPDTAGGTRVNVSINDVTPPVDRDVATLSVTQPDGIVVDALTTPTDVTPGETVTVAANVTNTNAGAVTTNASVRFDADGSGQLEADETLDTQPLALNASETRRVSFDIQVPSVTDGTYLLGAFAGNGSQTASVTVAATRLTPDAVTADADGDGQFGTDDANTTASIPVGETAVGAVRVTNASQPLADETVNLSLTAPTGVTASDVLNATTLRTNADGVAQFTITPEAVGTYDLVATAGTVSRNLTYTATPGAVDRVAVTGVKDAVIGGPTADTNLAAYEIRLEDANGSLVTDTGVDVSVAPGVSGASVASVVATYDRATGARNGTVSNTDGDTSPYNYDPAADPGEQGVFYALVDVNGTAEGGVPVTVEPGVSAIDGDTGTVVAHSLERTGVSLDPTEAVVGRTIAVTAVGRNASGGAVRVPRLPATFGSDDPTVVSEPTPSPTTTGLDGTATASATTVGLGSDDVTARVGDASLGSAPLTVESAQAGASNATIEATPATVSTTATHTVTVRVDSLTDTRSLDALRLTYANGSGSVDVSGVTSSDLVGATIDGVPIAPNATGVTAVDATTLEVGFDGTIGLERTDRLVVRVAGVTHSATPGAVAANVSVNPGTAPVDAANASVRLRERGSVDLSALSAPTTATGGQLIDVGANVTSRVANGSTATVDVRFDADGDGRLRSGETLAAETLQVDTNVTRVTFAVRVPRLANDSYLLGVFADNDSLSTLVAVGTPPTLFPSGIPGGSAGRPPVDVDNDGLYEDMDGDGRFTFVDIIEFVFAIQNADYSSTNLSQAQIDSLDHERDGVINFVDVIDLVFELQNR